MPVFDDTRVNRRAIDPGHVPTIGLLYLDRFFMQKTQKLRLSDRVMLLSHQSWLYAQSVVMDSMLLWILSTAQMPHP